MQQELHWDDVLAVGYAAEQLFVAAQLLTSDVIPLEEAVSTACDRHIARLLEYRNQLPGGVAARLELCFRECPADRALTHEQAEALSRRILGILDELRSILIDVAQSEDPGWLLNAA